MSRIQVEIKTEHLDEIKKMITHSMLFSNPEEYLDYVLEELLFSTTGALEHEDESVALEQRLRDLGYL